MMVYGGDGCVESRDSTGMWNTAAQPVSLNMMGQSTGVVNCLARRRAEAMG